MVEKIKPEMNIEVGSEEKFREFIKNIRNYDKVALISHVDLDGISCPKIITEFVIPEKIKFVNYMELDDNLINNLKEEGINKIIFTDLYIHEENFIKKLEKFAEILIIDHHESPDWNSNRTTLIKAQGYCANYMCYSLFSTIKDIEKWDWLVACTCISDYFFIKPQKWLSEVMKKYGDSFELTSGRNIRHSGKFWDLQYTLSLAIVYFGKDHNKVYNKIGEKFGDIDGLKKHAEIVRNEIKNTLIKFSKEKEKIRDGWYFDFDSKLGIKSIVINILSEKNQNDLFIVIKPHGGFYSISARCQSKRIDCNKFLKNLLRGLKKAEGGGHIPAAGGHFLKEDLPVIRERLGLPKEKIKTFK